jgi:poly(A) polymerase Pap1
LLAYDRNSDGRINDGRELFGDANGASDGFAELRKYDSDGNNRIDGLDPIFAELRIWQDKDGDGLSDENELKNMEAYDIRAIDLTARQTDSRIAGNTIAGISSYHTSSASAQIGEVFLNFMA